MHAYRFLTLFILICGSAFSYAESRIIPIDGRTALVYKNAPNANNEVILSLESGIEAGEIRFPERYRHIKSRSGSQWEALEDAINSGELTSIAWLGDSLSRDFHVDTAVNMISKMKQPPMNRGDRSPELNLILSPLNDDVVSLSDRISEYGPFVIHNYASVSADVVDFDGIVPALVDAYAVNDMDNQVSKLLMRKNFPDIVGIWLGHNNVDWALHKQANSYGTQNKAEIFDHIRADFIAAYEKQLNRLIEKADGSSIVVYGLVNFPSFFRARNQCEGFKLASQNQESAFPFFYAGEATFPSLQDGYTEAMSEVSYLMSRDLEILVNKLNAENPNVNLHFSNAMEVGPIEECRILHPMDAWHLSDYGKTVLSGYLFEGLEPILNHSGQQH